MTASEVIDGMGRRNDYRSRHRRRLIPLVLGIALVVVTVILLLGLIRDTTDVLGCQWDRATNGEPVADAECTSGG